MVNINIEIPGDLHKKLRLQSVMEDLTMKGLIIKFLEQEMKNTKEVPK